MSACHKQKRAREAFFSPIHLLCEYENWNELHDNYTYFVAMLAI